MKSSNRIVANALTASNDAKGISFNEFAGIFNKEKTKIARSASFDNVKATLARALYELDIGVGTEPLDRRNYKRAKDAYSQMNELCRKFYQDLMAINL